MILFLLFLLGLCVGSFLNVLIDRLPKNESVIKGRSHCDHCKKTLAWNDLIPVFSFLSLGGKCRYCHSPLSFYYPLVELVTGILFVTTFLLLPKSTYQFSIINYQFIYALFIISSFIVILFTDIKYGIIPDKIVYPAIAVSFIYLLLNTQYVLLSSILSAVGAFLFFLILFLGTRGRGMGFGDVKLSFWLGLLLGFPKIVISLYLAFVIGAFVAIILVFLKKKKLRGSTIPFGPFMVLGAFLSLFFGDFLLHQYILFFIR